MKIRLRARFEALLDSVTERPRTIDDLEGLALNLRAGLAQAVLEEVGPGLFDAAAEPVVPESEPSEAPETKDSSRVAALSSAVRNKVACPHCRHGAWFKGERARQIMTLAGTVTLRRGYYHCRRCRHGFCPADAALGLCVGTSFSRRVQQETAYLCASLPFAQAMQTLGRLTHASVSARSAQRLCVSGKSAVGVVAQEFAQAREAECLPLSLVSLPALPPDLPRPEVLYAAADGVHTPMRDGSFREMKIGVVRAEHRDGRVAQPSRYVNLLGDSEQFGNGFEALAIDSGALGAAKVVVLGDGAPWLWRMAQKRLPLATQILDFFHAQEYIGAVAREAFGTASEGEEGPEAKQWRSERAAEMKRSQWNKVRDALKAMRAKAPEAVETALRYFRNNAARMDYAHYLRQGLSIGSGIVEASCKRLVTQRLKGSGMRWSEKGAQAICTLRCLVLGQDGEEWNHFIQFWKQRSPYQKQCMHSPLL